MIVVAWLWFVGVGEGVVAVVVPMTLLYQMRLTFKHVPTGPLQECEVIDI